MHISDSVWIAVVTTVPTLLTVSVTSYINLSRQKVHGEKLDENSVKVTDVQQRTASIETSVNGNTQALMDANQRLTDANAVAVAANKALTDANRILALKCPLATPRTPDQPTSP